MRIDAGSHGVLESPSRLIDAASGSVHLRLVPLHLSRLHPPDLRGDFVPCDGDPSSPYESPLLRGASPVDVTLRGGLRPSEVSAGLVFEPAGDLWSISQWRWIACALTPFGWVRHPSPQFIRGRTDLTAEDDLLASLSLAPSCGTSREEDFHAAEDWLVSELGPPHDAGDSREWHYEWGSVVLAFEIRDGAAQAYISWEPLHSELRAETRERLRSLRSED
jgi:hypothetical protein